MDTSGLRFKSMPELLAVCALTEQQVRQFEMKSCDVTFKSFKTMTKAAQEHRGDLEKQYEYLMKAGELASLIGKNSKFKYWEPSQKSIFHDDFSKAIEEASNIQAVLEKKYEDLKIRQDKFDRAVQRAEEKNKGSGFPAAPSLKVNRPLMDPRDLIKQVENENPKKSAVIFDIRRDQSDYINYFRNELITVIQVPHNVINSSLTLTSLRDNLSVSQRALLSRLTKYDYVVLMDEKTPELKNGIPAPQTPMSFLFRALTEYARTDYRLRERPLFMDGGFTSWKAKYAMYTNQVTPATPRSAPRDAVDDVISGYRLSSVSDLRYPDLNAREQPPPAQEPPRQPMIPPRPPPEVQQPPAQRPGFGVYPSVQPITAARPIIPPTLDRPGGPIFNPPPPVQQYQKPIPPAPQVPIFPDRSIKPMTMPERPALLRKKDPSPTRSERSNGGGDPLKRPPLLDRATKPFNNQSVTSSKEYEVQLQSIYEQMKMAIERCSRRANSSVPGATGLFNMGNTCFMSATLQCLFQTPGLPEVFTKRAFVSKVNTESKLGSKGIVSAGFAALMDAIWSGQYDAIKPARFLQLFADEISSVLSDGKQHDASEFQIFLLDALHEDTNQARRMGFEQNYHGGAKITVEAADFIRRQAMFSSSPVNRLFGGVSVSEIRCRTCGESSATFEENTLISVELTSTNQCTLDSCLKSHFSETSLDGDSRWNCPKCRQPRIATRRSKLWSLPSVMIIHLKRFALFNGEFEKNSAAVTFDPHRFDAKPYLHESASGEKTTYRLYATTIHNGRLNSGHYTAVASHLKNDKWLRFDDESVRPIDRYSVDPSLAYILFYKRC